MYQAVFCIVVSVIFLWNAERCRKYPEKCKDSFMTEQGWTRSVFAIKYIGRAKEARDAIVQDHNLRKKHLAQCYISSIFFGVVGIAWLVNALG